MHHVYHDSSIVRINFRLHGSRVTARDKAAGSSECRGKCSQTYLRSHPEISVTIESAALSKNVPTGNSPACLDAINYWSHLGAYSRYTRT